MFALLYRLEIFVFFLQPMDVIITRWRGDIFSGGSFSYVPPNCAGKYSSSLVLGILRKTFAKCEKIRLAYYFEILHVL